MSKSKLAFLHELRTVFTSRSFIITLFVLPLIGFLVFTLVTNLNKGEEGGPNALTGLFMPPEQTLPEGYIDMGNLIRSIPEDAREHVIAFINEDAAKNALLKGEIGAYYIIPLDIVADGRIIYVPADYNPLSSELQSGWVQTVIKYNLVGGNLNLTYRLNNPLNVDQQVLSNPEARNPENPLTFLLPYIVTMLYYIIILTSSSLLLNSVAKEKQNRMIEVLMTSITPLQLLSSKIVALGIAGLLQTIVWSGLGLLLLRISGRNMELGSSFQLPFSILLWGILFFLLGYGLYASLMAGVGALVPNLREAGSVTTIIIMPLIIPMIFINQLITNPDGVMATVLSIFPLTAPVSMMSRLASGPVPIWQMALALFLCAATTLLIIRAVAGMFRAQNLLSGQAFSFSIFMKALIGKI